MRDARTLKYSFSLLLEFMHSLSISPSLPSTLSSPIEAECNIRCLDQKVFPKLPEMSVCTAKVPIPRFGEIIEKEIEFDPVAIYNNSCFHTKILDK